MTRLFLPFALFKNIISIPVAIKTFITYLAHHSTSASQYSFWQSGHLAPCFWLHFASRSTSKGQIAMLPFSRRGAFRNIFKNSLCRVFTGCSADHFSTMTTYFSGSFLTTLLQTVDTPALFPMLQLRHVFDDLHILFHSFHKHYRVHCFSSLSYNVTACPQYSQNLGILPKLGHPCLYLDRCIFPHEGHL